VKLLFIGILAFWLIPFVTIIICCAIPFISVYYIIKMFQSKQVEEVSEGSANQTRWSVNDWANEEEGD